MDGKSQLGVIKNRKGSLVLERATNKRDSKESKTHEHQKQPSPRSSSKKKKKSKI